MPHLLRVGITRVSNVTHLDYIGIPVYRAVRPMSRSLSVTYGAGIDDVSARLSAIVDSMRRWHAEYVTLSVRMESYLGMKTHALAANPSHLPLCDGSLYKPTRILPWIEGFDLLQQEPVWVPFELVHAANTFPEVPGSGCFDQGTAGLASGYTPAEALLNALCELIECNATSRLRQSRKLGPLDRRLDLATVEEQHCRELIARIERAQFKVIAWDAANPLGIPMFGAAIFGRGRACVDGSASTAAVFGSHPDRSAALMRTLLEAVRNHMTMSCPPPEEDHSKKHCQLYEVFEDMIQVKEANELAAVPVDFRRLSTKDHGTLEEEIVWILEQLRSVGSTQVIAIDLSRNDLPISVMRVVVPQTVGASPEVCAADYALPGGEI